MSIRLAPLGLGAFPTSRRGAACVAALVLLVIPSARAATMAQGFQETVVFTAAGQGLLYPTAVRFAPDGRIFIAEKGGQIKVFNGRNDPAADVVADLGIQVHDFWDRGLLGLALDPQFPAEPYVYVFYTYNFDPFEPEATVPYWPDGCPELPGAVDDGCVVNARLSRLPVASDNTLAGSEQVLLENRWCQQYPSHSVGALVFRPDGALCLSAGDGANFNLVDYGQGGGGPGSPTPANPCDDPPAGRGGLQTLPAAEGGALRSQDLRTPGDPLGYNGAVICIDPASGAPWPANPLVGGDPEDDAVVAYGLRNPFRMTVRPGTNELWVGDVGWVSWEEINRIEEAPAAAGARNCGWPCYEGPGRQDSYDAAQLDLCELLYTETEDPATAPYFTYARIGQFDSPDSPFRCSKYEGAAISGLAFYEGQSYPQQFTDALFFSDNSRECIWYMLAGADGLPDPATVSTFGDNLNAPVDLQLDPLTGELCYIAVFNSSLRCLQYVEVNDGPTAVIAADTQAGLLPLAVQFDGAASSDPDPFDTLSYEWDLDGDGAYDDATGPDPGHTYTTAGQHVAALRVQDEQGLVDSDTLTITAGNSAPAALILEPGPSLQWSVGQSIAFRGRGVDVEDGMLSASRLRWELVLYHCPGDCHPHLLQAFDGVAEGSFSAPDHEWYSYLELRLTVTDLGLPPGGGSGQLSSQSSVRLEPAAASLSFTSEPAGLSLMVNGEAQTTPFNRTVIAGSTNPVSAPSPQSHQGASYAWSSWSDLGQQDHEVVASQHGSSYVARYEHVGIGSPWSAIGPSSSVSYVSNVADPGLGMAWTEPGFDDSAWSAGSYGIGYEGQAGAENLIQTHVPESGASIYTRVEFELTNAATVESIALGADYDDGYAAWLNGVEVYRSPELPAEPLTWDTPATAHESSNGQAPSYYPLQDITASGLPLLQDGPNLLAIAIWNSKPGSEDLVLAPSFTINHVPTVVRGPYLQQGGPDRVVVRWRTDVPTSSRVLFGSAPDSLDLAITDSILTTEKSIELVGLAPETRYYYAIGTSGEILLGGDFDHFFMTAPEAGSSRPTRVWVVGDAGISGPAARDVRDAYLAFSGSRHTDLWLMLGGGALPDGTDPQYQTSLFDLHRDLLRKSVLWPAMGAEDRTSSSSATQSGPYYNAFTLPAAAEAGGVASGTEAYYSFDYANMHFLALNSTDVDRTPGSAMLSWLEQDLAATTQDWIIAFWHHPPYSKGSHNSDSEIELIEMRQNVLPILEAHGVDLTLTGHSHSYERSFLIDGHYGDSTTFGPAHVVDGGDGQEAGTGAYMKPELGPSPHQGAVHLVAGCSGNVLGGTLDHPAMFSSLNLLGSVVLDVAGNRLDARFLGSDGSVLDHVTLRKGVSCPKGGGQDADGDSICEDLDNCPITFNADQADRDADGLGDACDLDECVLSETALDSDGDGLSNCPDNCPGAYNPAQANLDSDPFGDACDCAPADPVNAPPAEITSPLQLEEEAGGTHISWTGGGVPGPYRLYRGWRNQVGSWSYNHYCASAAVSADHVLDPFAPRPFTLFYYFVTRSGGCGESGLGQDGSGAPIPNNAPCPSQGVDADGDGHEEALDTCPGLGNPSQVDTDGDGLGDPCDNCLSQSNPAQENLDGDELGDGCDLDVDGDAVDNELDNCLRAHNSKQLDADSDGLGDECDNCPLEFNPAQQDADLDGVGDACDPEAEPSAPIQGDERKRLMLRRAGS